MDQVSLSKGLLAQGYDVKVLVLANSGGKVELTPRRTIIHQLVVVFVADLFFHQLVASVFLCVCSHLACILCLDSCEVLNLCMLCLRLSIAFFLSSIILDYFGPLWIILA